MNYYKYAAMMVALSAFVAIVTTQEGLSQGEGDELSLSFFLLVDYSLSMY
jgi:hypothetical protein